MEPLEFLKSWMQKLRPHTANLRADIRPSLLPNTASMEKLSCNAPEDAWTFEDYTRVHDTQQWRKTQIRSKKNSYIYFLGRRDAFMGRTSCPPRYYLGIEAESQDAIFYYTMGYTDGLADMVFGTCRIPTGILTLAPEYADPVLSAHMRATILRGSMFGGLLSEQTQPATSSSGPTDAAASLSGSSAADSNALV